MKAWIIGNDMHIETEYITEREAAYRSLSQEIACVVSADETALANCDGIRYYHRAWHDGEPCKYDPVACEFYGAHDLQAIHAGWVS